MRIEGFGPGLILTMPKRQWLQKKTTGTLCLHKALVYIFIVLCWNYVLLKALLRDDAGYTYQGLDTVDWKQPFKNATKLRFTRRLHEKYHRAQYKLFYPDSFTCPLPCTETVCHLSIRGYPSNTQSRNGFISVNGEHVHTWSNSEPSLNLVVLRGSCTPKTVNSFTDPAQADRFTSSDVRRGDVIAGASSGEMSEFSGVLLRLCIGSDLKTELLRELSPLDTWAFLYTPGRRGESKCWVWQNGSESSVWVTKYTFGKEFPVLHRKGDLDMETLIKLTPGVIPGGRWRPLTCRPRSKIAVVVPYRDREAHLRSFLGNMHRFLQQQLVDYTIVVVEQADSHPFNRAALLNVGYLEMTTTEHFDCLVYHDVDLVPEDLCNFYYCGTQPRLLCVARNSYRYRVAYWHYFGGAVMLNSEQMETISGFPTSFYGWGGEDDEIWMRLRVHNMQPARYAAEVSTYYQLEHESHKQRIDRWLEIFDHARYTDDGLLYMRYKLLSVRKEPLFTHIKVELPPPR